MKLETYEFTRSTFDALAKVGVLTFSFTKKDTFERNMIGTLMPDVIRTKVNDSSENAHLNIGNYTPFRIFDLELDEWRSFIPNNVCSASWIYGNAYEILKIYPITKTRTLKLAMELKVLKGSIDYVTVAQIEKTLKAVGYKITTITDNK